METQTTYKPKENHPWRRYRNRINPSTLENESKPQLPAVSLKSFLFELVNNYDTYSIPSTDTELGGVTRLAGLRADKQAEWLIGFLKRHWLYMTKGALIFE